MSGAPLLLVTYGTVLRAVDGVERLGIADRSSFVETCQFAGVLYDLGRFPGAVPGEGTVHGELFRLHDPEVWTVLDRYEGYDADREEASLFVRRRIDLLEPSDQTAWIYWFNGDPTGHPQVGSGDWAAYVRDAEKRERIVRSNQSIDNSLIRCSASSRRSRHSLARATPSS